MATMDKAPPKPDGARRDKPAKAGKKRAKGKASAKEKAREPGTGKKSPDRKRDKDRRKAEKAAKSALRTGGERVSGKAPPPKPAATSKDKAPATTTATGKPASKPHAGRKAASAPSPAPKTAAAKAPAVKAPATKSSSAQTSATASAVKPPAKPSAASKAAPKTKAYPKTKAAPKLKTVEPKASDTTQTGASRAAGPKGGAPHENTSKASGDRAGTDGAGANGTHATPPKLDIEAFSQNAALYIGGLAKAAEAYFKPLSEGHVAHSVADEVSDAVKTLGQVAETWMSDPARAVEAQTAIATGFLDLWSQTLRKMSGEPARDVAPADPRDKRFADPDWQDNPLFDFLKQAYLLGTRWADDMVERAEGLDEHTRHKARFYVRQLSSALSPSNFLATNPELIRQTWAESGANLVRGVEMLAQDIKAGGGTLKVRQTEPGPFQLGVNMANTPGKVVFRNDLIELIQYAPATETVLKRPLLIVPPWINKYYILDLNPEKSFIRWAVAQGLTVFCISWVNPDARHAEKSFADYMREGIFAALDMIRTITGEEKVSAIGYCVGGTLLAVTLAYMAGIRDRRIASATFFTTQVDFTHAGDLKVFVDEEQVKSLEEKMAATGYLSGARMANAFNMLRPNDLIWPYIVNNYMKGQAPFPFDLLVWNSDSTRMPAANHSFYLRHCYLNNDLASGRLTMENVRLDLGRITIPIYNLAAREDHIAPAKSVFLGSKLFGGPVDFVLAGSGHIAGVINPPAKPKYQYWTGDAPTGEFDNWLSAAQEHPGSWWPHWFAWVEKQAPERVPARQPGADGVPVLCDAPGTYVLAKA